MDDYYDMSDNFLLRSNITGGAGRKESKWNKFVREYKKYDPKASFSKISREYKSKSCSKKFTNCKSKSKKKPVKISKSCKGYSSKLKKLKSSTARGKLRKKCVGYTKKGRGSTFGGDIFGGEYECPKCDGTGQGLYGGCGCCGGMGYMGGAKPPKKCVSANALLQKIRMLRILISKYKRDGAPLGLIQRLVGALRQMEVMYKRQKNVGLKFIESRQFDYPGKQNWVDSDNYFLR